MESSCISERHREKLLSTSKKKSSNSIESEYTAVWLQSLWIKKSRSVSTSGLRRDGLSSCCCCQILVQKKNKVMEGRDSQERHKQKEKFTLHTSDLKTEYAGLFYVYGQVYVLYHRGGQIQYWWKQSKTKLQQKEPPCMTTDNKKTLMSNVVKQSHFVWSMIMFFSYQKGKSHPNAYLLFDSNIGEYHSLWIKHKL